MPPGNPDRGAPPCQVGSHGCQIGITTAILAPVVDMVHLPYARNVLKPVTIEHEYRHNSSHRQHDMQVPEDAEPNECNGGYKHIVCASPFVHVI